MVTGGPSVGRAEDEERCGRYRQTAPARHGPGDHIGGSRPNGAKVPDARQRRTCSAPGLTMLVGVPRR